MVAHTSSAYLPPGAAFQPAQDYHSRNNDSLKIFLERLFAADVASVIDFISRSDALVTGLPPRASQPWLLGSGTATMEVAIKLKTSYCHSLTHRGCRDDPAIMTSYQRTVGRQHGAVLVAGICAPDHATAEQLLSHEQNGFIKANVVGNPAACADELRAVAQRYQVEHVIWIDLSPERAALRRSISLLAEALSLTE